MTPLNCIIQAHINRWILDILRAHIWMTGEPTLHERLRQQIMAFLDQQTKGAVISKWEHVHVSGDLNTLAVRWQAVALDGELLGGPVVSGH